MCLVYSRKARKPPPGMTVDSGTRVNRKKEKSTEKARFLWICPSPVAGAVWLKRTHSNVTQSLFLLLQNDTVTGCFLNTKA